MDLVRKVGVIMTGRDVFDVYIFVHISVMSSAILDEMILMKFSVPLSIVRLSYLPLAQYSAMTMEEEGRKEQREIETNSHRGR